MRICGSARQSPPSRSALCGPPSTPRAQTSTALVLLCLDGKIVCRRPLISAQNSSMRNLCVSVALTDLHKTRLNSVVSIFTDHRQVHVRMKDNRQDKSSEQIASDAISICTLSEKLKKSPNDILNAIQSLERRTFPSSECLAIAAETSKRNTQLLYAQSSSGIVGYLIFIHTPSGLRIHKVCIAEAFRRRGIATGLIERVCDIAGKAGKDIDLWVNEARIPARECYVKCGFAQVGETVIDYYGPARNGIRMVWKCE
jgi:ribosomal protein S18 acetylase RimI-like enzyme